MARINNLRNFLTDVAAAIKEKTGDSSLIPAENFDTEILNIETGGNYQEKEITIITNGSHSVEPDQGYDAISELTINVNVPSENLDNVITIQENKLNTLETILESKISAPAKSNIFVQETEPTKKDGIWLQMNKTAEHYISDNNITVGGWSANSNIPDYINPMYIASVGTDIYLLGGFNNYNYKYDTSTDTYTKMADIPYTFAGEFSFGTAIAAAGTNIYLFGDSEARPCNYKYDTLTDTYTQMNDIPFNFNSGAVVTVGTDIYLYGGSDRNDNHTYKYDTLTDTYTQISGLGDTERTYGCKMVAVGTDIYLYAGWVRGVTKYDTLTDTIVSGVRELPFSFGDNSVSVSSVGTDIYLFGFSNKPTSVYKYDTLTNTYTQLPNAPYELFGTYATTVGTDIYLLTSDSSYKYDTVVSTYDTDNTVVIEQGNTYSTALIKTDFEEGYQPIYTFDDVYFYTLQDGLDGTMPVYYGDGTQWVNIKNPIQGGAE